MRCLRRASIPFDHAPSRPAPAACPTRLARPRSRPGGRRWASVRGQGVGDSEAQARQLYGARLVSGAPTYFERRHRLAVSSADRKFALVMASDGSGRMVTLRGGRVPAVKALEGCSRGYSCGFAFWFVGRERQPDFHPTATLVAPDSASQSRHSHSHDFGRTAASSSNSTGSTSIGTARWHTTCGERSIGSEAMSVGATLTTRRSSLSNAGSPGCNARQATRTVGRHSRRTLIPEGAPRC